MNVKEVFLNFREREAEVREREKEIKAERKCFFESLSQIKFLKVYPSQANYFMCELLDGHTSEELAGRLLKKNILIKDLTGKIKNGGQYIRIAIRTSNENRHLVQLLKEEMQ